MVKTRRGARKANVTAEEDEIGHYRMKPSPFLVPQGPPAGEEPEEVNLSRTSQASKLRNRTNDRGGSSKGPPAGEEPEEVHLSRTSQASKLRNRTNDSGGSSKGPPDKHVPDSVAMIVSHLDNLTPKLVSLKPILADYFDDEGDILKAAYTLRKKAEERTLHHSSGISTDVGSMFYQN